MTNATQRFSSRVENYVKYRPSYPPAILQTLHEDCGLTHTAHIADIGSGTGFLSELFLRNGNQVYGVEPNREMRLAGEALLQGYANFVSVAGTAEATTLPDHSVDFVTAGQAFHWFDLALTRPEFARILRPNGWLALVWNDRQIHTSLFMAAFEELLHSYGIDYAKVTHQRPDFEQAAIESFFGPQGCRVALFPNQQTFDYAGLEGRLLSSSYAPEPNHPNFAPMMVALHKLFDQHQVAGQITFTYQTRLFFGQLSA